MNAVTISTHLADHTHAVLTSCSSYAHRRIALEVLREGLRRFVCFGTEYPWDGVGLRVHVEDISIDWPLTIELIRDAQAERGEWVSRWCPLWG